MLHTSEKDRGHGGGNEGGMEIEKETLSIRRGDAEVRRHDHIVL